MWLEHHAVENPRLSMLAAGIAIVRREFAAALELLEYAATSIPQLTWSTLNSWERIASVRESRTGTEAFERALAQNGDDPHALDGMAALCLRPRRL